MNPPDEAAKEAARRQEQIFARTLVSDAHPRTHEDYQIGVICALATEKAAMVAMLDEIHPKSKKENGDDNEYTLGRIGVHNVVIACLPAGLMGNGPAAIVANNMRRSFPIKFGLMVGIGGGVWSKKGDIRLGDVVVSQPTGTHGGVVQWDFGKMEKDGKFQRTGSLDKPPPVLLHALQELRTFDITDGVNLEESLSLMVQNKPRMGQTYRYQGADHDQLFEATYDHEGGETCDDCDPKLIVQRLAREDFAPKIHYGNIASGNEVMKHGTTRDKIAKEEGVICFEMEAAGLMDNFRCLVIRGICDYADSHKNKIWQPYAAATAAAFARVLLGFIDEQEVIRTPHITHELFSSLTFPDIDRRWHLIDTAEQGTCKWIFSHPEYVKWDKEGRKFIWIKGKPGSGKSTLMKHLSEVQTELCPTTGAYIAKFFINGRGDTMEYTMHGLLRALLYQTLRQHKDLLKHTIQYFHDKMKKQGKRIKWEDNELKELLAWGSRCGPKTFWIIDAMDEFKEDELRMAVRFFQDIAKNPKGTVRLCLASRHYPDIRVNDCAEIQMESGNGEDIRLYVESKLAQERSSYHISVQDTEWLISQIITRAQSMFIWARIAIERLLLDIDDGESFRKISNTLAQFPEALESIYHDLIKGIISKGLLRETIWLVRWILYSARPMTVTEIRQAFSWKYKDDGISNDHQMSRWIKSRSHGLIEVRSLELPPNGESHTLGGFKDTENLIAQFSHQSVKDYFSQVEALQQINPSFSTLTTGESSNVLMHDCIDYVQSWTYPSQEMIENASLHAKGDCNEDCCFFTDDEDSFDTEDVLPTLRIYQICDEHHKLLFAPCQFLEYASSFWLYHAREAEKGGAKLASLSRRFGTGCNEEDLYQRLRCLYDICCSRSKSDESGALGPHCQFIAAAALHNLLSAVETSLLLGEGLSVESFPEQIPAVTDDLHVNYLNHWSLMGIAAGRGYVDMVRLLLEHNVPLRSVPHKNIHRSDIEICLAQSPIVEAVRSADIDIVNLIIEDNSHTEGLSHQSGHPQLLKEALAEAISQNDAAMVKFVIAKGADTQTSQGGLSILERAMESSNIAVLEVLLTSNAVPTLTALDIAISCRRYGALSLLRRHGITINSPDHQGRTAFLRLLVRSRHISSGDSLIQNFIRQCRPYVTVFDINKITTLHFMAAAGMAGSFQLALELGADISAKDSSGSAVIHYAATIDDKVYADELIDLIIDNGTDINERDANGNTALHIAASLGRKNVVRHLLRRGAELKALNNSGLTPVNLGDTRVCQLGSQLESMEIQVHEGLWSQTVYRGNVTIATNNIVEVDAFREKRNAKSVAIRSSDIQSMSGGHRGEPSAENVDIQPSDIQNIPGEHRRKRRRTVR